MAIQKRLKEIQNRKIEIRNAIQNNADIDLDATKQELDKLEIETRSLNEKLEIANAINVGNIGAEVVETPKAEKRAETQDIYSTIEYRQAFMNHITKGTKIPAEYRADAVTKTTDVGALIPSNVLNKIIEKIEATGMILPLVTRTAVRGGMTIPTSSIKPVATWVAEGASSDKQKKDTTGTITFAYYKLRCVVAVTLETETMALSAFESVLISNIVEAMVKALEQAIISGTGVGCPKGILTETPNAGQEVTGAISYKLLCDAEAALPLEYEDGAVYVMSKKSFMAYVAMVDSNGQPIARVTHGINGRPERTLLGRTVILCNYVPADVHAFLFNFSDYVLNTNYQMGLKKYEDNETDDLVTKAIMIADGKVIVKDSLVVVKKA